MNQPFHDLGITGLIAGRCYAVNGSILRIHLQLSNAPPLGWSYLFTQTWQDTEYPGKRPAGIDEDALWIECAPEDVRALHWAHIEQALAQTNARYREQHRQKELNAAQQRELSRLTHLKLEELAHSFAPAPPPAPDDEWTESPPDTLADRILDFLRSLGTCAASGKK